MPIIDGKEQERQGILQVAAMMAVSARTAPKIGGVDDIFTVVVYGDEKDAIAAEMEKMAEERKTQGFKRDAGNVRNSEAVVLIGIRGTKKMGVNCGACGYTTCHDFEQAGTKPGNDFAGPTCIFKAIDLGIALGSAAKSASLFNVDNRIMYRVGTAARRLGHLPEASNMMGIPLSARGKSPYFDRG
jgi:uncharacterized ferredoxin-like protein